MTRSYGAAGRGWFAKVHRQENGSGHVGMPLQGDPGHCAGINKRTQRKESMEGKTREKENEIINVKSEQKECNASALLPSRRTFCVPSATTSSRTSSRRRMGGTHTTARPSCAGVEKKVLATEVGALYAQRWPQNAKCQRCRKDIRPMFIERHSFPGVPITATTQQSHSTTNEARLLTKGGSPSFNFCFEKKVLCKYEIMMNNVDWCTNY